jgi:hypothetical protein
MRKFGVTGVDAWSCLPVHGRRLHTGGTWAPAGCRERSGGEPAGRDRTRAGAAAQWRRIFDSVFLPGFAGRLGPVKMIVRRDVVRARGFAASFADV